MKHILLPIILCCTLSVTAQRFEGGIIGGLTASQVDGDRYSGYTKLGTTFGFYTNLPASETWKIQLEFKYAARGAYSGRSQFNPEYVVLSLNYFEMPLLAITEPLPGFSLEAGLAPAFLFSERWRDQNGIIPTGQTEPFNNIDLGLLLGTSLSMNERINLNLRLLYSILPARERTTGYYYGRIPEMLGIKEGDYNNSVSLSVYYQLGN